MKDSIKNNYIPLILAAIIGFLYLQFAYDLERTSYGKLLILYTGLFLLTYKLIELSKDNFKLLVVFSIIIRLLFLFAIPNLSQDFYRFIWDGRMILEGVNPYLFTPESFMQNNVLPVEQSIELYNGMGTLNGSHFTNYPPVNQFCFMLASLFNNSSILGSVIVLRVLIILADLGILYVGLKLLKSLKLSKYNIFLYALNPFVIIELTGNLHFEGIMIFFLIWSMYLLYQNKWKWAAVLFALSVSTKLIPLIFLPLLFQKLRLKKSIGFYSIVIFINVMLFLPFFTIGFVDNYLKTVGLWFQNFEFNASLYYIAREIGYLFRGYNEIAIIGKVIPLIVVIFVVIITFLRRNKSFIELFSAMLLVLSFYYFTATTVHPWYIALLLIITIFTKYRFPVVWSFIIIVSYLAYASSNNKENLWLIAIEYLVVYGYFVYELFIKKHKLKSSFYYI